MKEDRDALRDKLGLTGKCRSSGSALANQGPRPQKGSPEQFAAFAQFRQKHPKEALLGSTRGSRPGRVSI